MSIESRVHDLLANLPVVKKVVKRGYQVLNVTVTRPKKSEGRIERITPDDGYEYLFGYYDKSPWDTTNQYMLCLRVKDAAKNVAPGSEAEIVLIDTAKGNAVEVIAKTRTWNVQQGCMLGWLGPKFDKEIFYNDFRDGKYCGVVKNIKTGKERLLERPVYSVSSDGKVALSLDFARLHRLRPGYGYSNLKDDTRDEKVPKGACVWKINMKTGKAEPVLGYEKLYDFEHRGDMEGAEHKVNHLMLSPNGKRFMLIHRWLKGGKKVSRLLTCDVNGENLYNLSDDNMVSHCCWKNDEEILAYCQKDGGKGYFLMKDGVPEFAQKWEWLTTDGHPSYSPDGSFVVTDTYPNKKRISTLRILSDTASTIIAKVYSPFKYDNDVRCDLHPRWSRDGKKICFDGCFEGRRGVYVVKVASLVSGDVEVGSKVEQKGKSKVLFVLSTCRKSGPTQVVFNIIKNLDLSKFEPVLLTLSEEIDESILEDILPYVSKHVFCRTKKINIMRGRLNNLKEVIDDEISPNVIHTTGVFPDYAISKISSYNQVVTMHNYAPFDYVTKFGKVRGWILIKMQYYAARHAAKTVACSKSLSELYKKDGFNFDYIRNGIDIGKYKVHEDKTTLRRKLELKQDSFIFIYTGQFIARKNIDFALDGFAKVYKNDSSKLFVLLGDGREFDQLREKYTSVDNIIFVGRVANVNEYLGASDVYVSASKSEGLPNGVLEAMACGLPVLLSDIPQHKEILQSSDKCGYCYPLVDSEHFMCLIKNITIDDDLNLMSVEAQRVVNNLFSSLLMSRGYQGVYSWVIKKRKGRSV